MFSFLRKRNHKVEVKTSDPMLSESQTPENRIQEEKIHMSTPHKIADLNDKTWGEYNANYMYHIQHCQFGQARNDKFCMAEQVRHEKKFRNAFLLYSECLLIDLTLDQPFVAPGLVHRFKMISNHVDIDADQQLLSKLQSLVDDWFLGNLISFPEFMQMIRLALNDNATGIEELYMQLFPDRKLSRNRKQ